MNARQMAESLALGTSHKQEVIGICMRLVETSKRIDASPLAEYLPLCELDQLGIQDQDIEVLLRDVARGSILHARALLYAAHRVIGGFTPRALMQCIREKRSPGDLRRIVDEVRKGFPQANWSMALSSENR